MNAIAFRAIKIYLVLNRRPLSNGTRGLRISHQINYLEFIKSKNALKEHFSVLITLIR